MPHDVAGPDDPDASRQSAVARANTLHCATGLPKQGDLNVPADSQVYRWQIVVDGLQGFALERSATELFTRSEELARVYANLDEPHGQGTTRVLLEAEATVHGNTLTMRWPGASLQAQSEQHTGLYVGTLEIDDGVRPAACWRDDFEPTYVYEAASGECQDSEGEPGRNQLPMVFVRETGNGECNDFGPVQLSETFAGTQLAGWNLRGADLTGTLVNFADMPDADFSGANLVDFSFGYFSGQGRFDSHTRLPPLREKTEDRIWFGDTGFPLGNEEPYYAWRTRCSERPLAEQCQDARP